jgi:hypothetical protein
LNSNNCDVSDGTLKVRSNNVLPPVKEILISEQTTEISVVMFSEQTTAMSEMVSEELGVRKFQY